jgi:hypothetical protein
VRRRVEEEGVDGGDDEDDEDEEDDDDEEEEETDGEIPPSMLIAAQAAFQELPVGSRRSSQVREQAMWAVAERPYKELITGSMRTYDSSLLAVHLGPT